MQFLPLRSLTIGLALLPMQLLVIHASSNMEAAKVLTMIPKLHIERNYISQEIAENLYQDALAIALPRPQDHKTFHKGLLELKEGKIPAITGKLLSETERVNKFHDLISENSTSRRGSGIIRFELLDKNAYNRIKGRINEVVENTVLDDDGTIHAYISLPESSALLNHTDTTDIFVLQLHGAKQWLLCQEQPFSGSRFQTEKLNKCLTYGSKEMDELACTYET
jgi:Cupin superfamily protein